MDTTKKLTVDEIQGYLAHSVRPLPFVYEYFLEQIRELEKQQRASMLPIAIFELYHFSLRRRLVERINACKQFKEMKRKAA